MSRRNYILSLGGNIGNVDANFRLALRMIKDAGHDIIRTSNIYMSEAWGFASKDLFRNMIAEVEGDISPFDMLALLQDIERSLGRTHKTVDEYYESRSIDIDIILCDDLTLETPRLTIPHPHMHKRNFVLIPLAEHWAEIIHPVLKENISTLLEKCEDENRVWCINDNTQTNHN